MPTLREAQLAALALEEANLAKEKSEAERAKLKAEKAKASTGGREKTSKRKK